MSKVHRLPAALANQIAAGEVVERPASVVKELIENALDAGARRISVLTEFGGKKLISVEDDGEGMSADDARLAVERHATSKLQTAADLAAIVTLGFRGEALPSIASVSRFRLRTRLRGELAGTEIRIDAGQMVSAKETGAPEGTLIEVQDLFFNLPARKKFLKADTAESAQISKLVTQLALGYPEVGFTLRNGGRVVIETPPAASLAERFFQMYGDRADLIEVRKQAAGITVHGYVAALAEAGPVRGPQHVFVNRRLVRDRTISHAIQQAYSVATIKERSPEVHLFIELPPDRVDVNVHPTKAEVRFLDQSLIHEVLRRAIVDALGQTGVPELVLSQAALTPQRPFTGALPLMWGRVPSASAALGPDAAGTDRAGLDPLGDAIERAIQSPGATVGAVAGRETIASLIRPMVPLGQFRNTFIIAVDEEGIAIIDQHVAHERILFEKISEQLLKGGLESQRLLTPVIMDFGAGEHATLKNHFVELEKLGFSLDDFGGSSIRVKAVPAILKWEHSEAALRAAAGDLEGLTPGAGIEESVRQLAATMACHAAVKANDLLDRDKMQFLLDELRRTAHSSVCPHGRPVVLRLTRREIERNFERI
ncbi:MAG: DNA mismatch repair endonuclease MutL [Acidobacteria bacterium]|nr:MAG: DNA mismatch repair endonuclease MutL [Acidobacteriota bacterium]